MYESLADTVLYEKALKIILETERAKYEGSANREVHKNNSDIYAEFWRRNKSKYYFQAHDQVMKSIGKHKAVINK